MSTLNPTITQVSGNKKSGGQNQDNLLKLCNSMIDIASVVTNFINGSKVNPKNGTASLSEEQASNLLQSDSTFWNSIKNSMDPAEYKLYLKTFPNGMFKSLAELRLSRFGQSEGSSQNNDNDVYEYISFAPHQVRDLLTAIKRGIKIINLEAGTFELPESLIFNQSVEIIGAGQDHTTLLFANLEGGLQFVASDEHQELKIRGVAFNRRGTQAGHVATIENGKTQIADCEFSGGVWSGLNRWEGCGIYLNNVTGTIKNNKITHNVHGMVVDGDSKINLETNYILDNQLSGISFAGNSGGKAINNSLEYNAFCGIAIHDESHPEISQNHLRYNVVAGLAYHNKASGRANNNNIATNGDGIILLDQSSPTFEDNCINLNQKSGMSYFDQASGVVRSNAIDKNGYDGVTLSGQANPTLYNNFISLNNRSGLVYLDQSSGKATKNTVIENRNGQIVIINKNASPELEDNSAEINMF